MAIYLSAGMIGRVVAELLRGGYPESTSAAVVYRATWPDQQTFRGTLSDIAEAVHAAGIDRQALILVGDALAPISDRDRSVASLLYDPAFGHGYRKASRP